MNRLRRNMLLTFLIIMLLGTAVFMLMSQATVPPTPPSYPVDTDGDGVPDADISFSMYQAIRRVFTDGSDSWAYPTSRTTLTPMTIIDTYTGKIVSSTQMFIYFTLISSKQVVSVEFNALASLEIYDENKQLYKTIVTDMPVSEMVANPQNGSDVQVISSSITASDLQALIIPSGVTFDYNLYYVVKIRDISADVIFADLSFETFGLTGVQADENQLWWKFRLNQWGTVMEVVNLGVEWQWT